MQTKTNLIGRIATRVLLGALAMFMLQTSANAQVFTATNTDDFGPGSLREGLMTASIIHFNIPSSDPNCNPTTGVCTIRPLSNLPTVSFGTKIDGYTQPGASVNTLAQGTNAILKIEIKGPTTTHGLRLFNAATIKGLIINNFPEAGVTLEGSGNTIVGCFIGTDATGTIAVPNGSNGDHSAVSVNGDCHLIGRAPHSGASNCAQIFDDTLPPAMPADRNLISGNATHGIKFPNQGGSGSSSNYNRIQNNLIGTQADGVSPLGNSLDGIFFRNNTSGPINDNLIMNNVIAFNGANGVNIAHGGGGTHFPPVRNRILANSIYSNGNIGISLGYYLGETNNNDPCDLDSGDGAPNELQNYPVITSASISNGNYLLNGFLNSTAGGTFTIQFYASDFCDFLTTKGEGKTYLGEITVSDTDSDCFSTFSASFPVPMGAGHVVTATATDSAGNTSEFSGCMPAGDACTPSPANQVSLYRAENNANDSNGVNHGTLQNGGTYAPGIVGQAFSLDGVDDKITIPDSPSLNVGPGSFTFETWAKFNAISSPNFHQVIAQKKTQFGYHLDMFQGVLRLTISASIQGASINSSNTTVFAGDWFHVAFVVDRATNTVRLYVNGALQTTQPSIAGSFDDTSPLYIGGDDQNHGLNGLIDETAIYNRALSEAEIQSIYFAGSSGKCEAPSISGHLNYANGSTPGKNVTMTLTGNNGFVTRTTTTDSNGDYALTNVPVGNDYTVTPSKTGDVNGIESLDASNVARYVAGLDIPTPNQQLAADADGDGILTSLDASFIARRVAGLPDTAIVGTWKFSPANVTYAAFSTEQAGQNFTAILVGDTSGNWTPALPLGGGLTSSNSPQRPDAPPLAVTVAMTHTTGPMGTNISMPIAVGDLTGQGVKAYDLQVTFNPAILQPLPTAYDNAGTPSSGMLITPNANNPGHLIISAFQATDLTGSGTLINLRFMIIGQPGQVSPTTFADYTDPGTIFHPGFRFNAGTPAATPTNGSIHVNGPTASSGRVSGRIVDDSGHPVEGAAVRMAGTQDRLTITDKEGNYLFDGVETGGFYTVTPSRANFVFSPAQRGFSQIGQNTEAVFTASDTGAGLNPLDTTEYFVRQQYLDFLGREPDEAGLNFWVSNLAACGTDSECRTIKRTDTSAAFFLSTEFQQTGYLVQRMYRSAYGDINGTPISLSLSEFRPDKETIGEGVIVNQSGWEAKLEANKQAYASEFVKRSRFTLAHPVTMTPTQFVDRLFLNGGVTPVDTDRTAAINEFSGLTDTADSVARARAVRRVAENATLGQQEFNQAFVLMQYFGYLGRDPNTAPDSDFSGYNFWLNKLDSFNGDFRKAEMVKAFLVAGEYRGRFPR